MIAILTWTVAPASAADGPPATPPPLRSAHPVPIPASTTAPKDFVLGEGWGCAALPFPEQTRWQCWDAGPHPVAFEVPWLADQRVVAGRDRVCTVEEHALRCFQRPIRGQLPRELADLAWRGVPKRPGETLAASNLRGDRAGLSALGAGFACLRTIKGGGVFCVGDDRFGQRAGSAPPAPEADARGPGFAHGTWPAEVLVAGTWHACALAMPKGLGSEYAACWGRDDAGQLGAPASSTCAAGGGQVPCARVPVHGPAVGTDDGLAELAAGDLFTCMATTEGLRCWGASRDGFFGTAQACPDQLRRAWPTLSGTVVAPHVGCATAPVTVMQWESYQASLAAGPRGLCLGERGGKGSQCFGAIPTPRGPVVGRRTPSPGDDAAACGLSGESVVCWGQGYTQAGALDQPVAVAFATAVPAAECARLDLPNFDSHKPIVGPGAPCRYPTPPLPTFAPGTAAAARPWSELLLTAAAGQTVHVRGALGVSNLGEVMTSNPPWVTNWLALAGPQPLLIADHRCGGYSGHLTCDLPAYGQTVVATGRLAPGADHHATYGAPFWVLASPVLCEERPGA